MDYPGIAESVIEIKDLSKSYGIYCAVAPFSITIRKGEIFGLLGPNGAGKSTTLEILETLKKKTGGKVMVGGLDLDTEVAAIKKKIGVQFQCSAFYPHLNLMDLLRLYAGIFQKSVSLEELITLSCLTHKKQAYFHQLSGGEKQRFALAVALLSAPEILYLDEPSAGLDPKARHDLWQIIQSVNQKGVTVVLTTHYMEEAAALCHRIVIMHKGAILAMGTPEALIQSVKDADPALADRTLTLEDVFLFKTKEEHYQ